MNIEFVKLNQIHKLLIFQNVLNYILYKKYFKIQELQTKRSIKILFNICLIT